MATVTRGGGWRRSSLFRVVLSLPAEPHRGWVERCWGTSSHLCHGPLRRAGKQGTSPRESKQKPQVQRARDKLQVRAGSWEPDTGRGGEREGRLQMHGSGPAQVLQTTWGCQGARCFAEQGKWQHKRAGRLWWVWPKMKTTRVSCEGLGAREHGCFSTGRRTHLGR